MGDNVRSCMESAEWGDLGPSRFAKTGLARVTIAVVSVRKRVVTES